MGRTAIVILAVAFLCKAQSRQSMEEGRVLPAAIVAALENSLERRPEDLVLRLRLIGYYTLSTIDGANLVQKRAGRRRHILWLIHHHPESDALSWPELRIAPSGVPLADEDGFEQAKRAWMRQLRDHPNSAKLEWNAVNSLSLLSDGAQKELESLAPKEPEWSKLLGRLHANAALRGTEGERSARILEDSSDPILIASAVSTLESPSASGDSPAANYQREELLAKLRGLNTIRVEPRVQAAKLARQVTPVYPPLARQARIQGAVRFNLLINEDGSVGETELVSGHPLLVQSAGDAVKQWVYSATVLNGRPLKVLTQVDVNFTLIQ